MAFEFIQKHRSLLNLEREAELEEARSLLEGSSSKRLSLKGVCFPKLVVSSQCTALYGRTLITLEPAKHHGVVTLPANQIRTGDVVGVFPSSGMPSASSQLLSGLVWQLRSSKVVIAVENQEEKLQDGKIYMLLKLSNDVTYKRLKRALSDLDKSSGNHSSHLQEVLFAEAELGPPLNLDISDLKFFNPGLDSSQREAVVFALLQREVAIVHGPPGTGKTTTVVEVILQAAKQGLKVVACAPSNVAVDNLVERLSRSKDVNVVRIGHPARLLSEIQRFSLDAKLAASDAGKLLMDVRKNIDKTLERASKTRQGEDRKSTWNELKHLRKELQEREQQAIRTILSDADVVLATNTSISGDGPVHLLPESHFDLVVIDECAQAVEAGCWIPLRLANKCVLAGDHKQLPPTIISERASKDGLSVSLMERLIDLHGDRIVRMLSTQYRMHKDIMSWSSVAMYDGLLRAHRSVSTHLLSDLPGVEDDDITSLPLLLIDTVGCGYPELELEEEASKGNEGEANLVVIHIERLIQSGVRAEDIAVITPYNLQVELIKHRLSGTYPGLEIKSVDGFQGREKEAVVMSLVRSNSRGEVGFLSEDRRMNVAVTRARRHLCLVCDTQTVSHHPFLKDLVEYMNSNGEVHSGFQYTQEVDDLSASHPLPDHMILNRPTHPQKKSREEGEKGSGPKVKLKKAGTKDRHPATTVPGKKSKHGQESKTNHREEASGQFQQELEEFLADSARKVLRFPSSLSSKDRFVIHELCTEMKLHHQSRGEGSERHILVSKGALKGPSIDQSESRICNGSTASGTDTSRNTVSERGGVSDAVDVMTQNSFDVAGFSTLGQVGAMYDGKTVTDVSDSSDTNSKVVVKETSISTGGKISGPSVNKGKSHSKENHCRFCHKSVPPGNLILHEIQCEKIQDQKTATKMQAQLRGKMDKSKQKNSLENTEETDPDRLMELAKKQDGVCNFKKCKEKVSLLGQLCQFCNKRYCLSHHIPEVHGCGELAKVIALKARKKEPSAGQRPKKVEPAHRDNLQRKLNNKLSEMEKSRRKSSKKK